MHERPADIADNAVSAALSRQWALTVRELSYLPVGFGGYHWLAIDQTGSRWFVTVSDLAAPWAPDLPGVHANSGLASGGGRPHQQTADTLVSWTALQDTLEAIAKD